MVIRYGPRAAVTCNVILVGEQTFCEGRVLDISLPGCLIECVHALRVGNYVQLRMFLPDQAAPMNVSLAAVSWVDRTKVVLSSFDPLKEDQYRLTKFIRRHGPPVAGQSNWKEAVTILGAMGD